MNGTNIKWDDLQFFLAVARSGGLSPAARATGSSPATLGRRMRTLEHDMGRELFIRHDRGYELTTEGRTLLSELTDVEARIVRLTAKTDDATRPLVKISAGTWTALLLLNSLDTLTGTPADIRLRFVSAEEVLDISRREVVIGFRNRRPSDERLAGRKLSRVEFAPYARADAPRKWIKVLADTPSARWLDKTIGKDAVCEVTSPRNCLDLALAGRGLALLPTFIGDAQPELERAGATIPELTHDQWLVTHQDDRHLPHVRRTLDRLADVLAGQYHHVKRDSAV
ncbi:LysR family transcriptional regulator [Litoreibacter arenae]|uniref:Transcriptional regulator, LysR family n=1 Tax=Litoreibacter arenae DSM 19593 TaxID=1123360 RepID=S9RSL2_9RHOB|nr:LysR family transcriptional regulator [Litoreibacter arenae]EPX76959.1 transcriptional regulator, LysR family [Litoreibacter arenae DSM 19593]